MPLTFFRATDPGHGGYHHGSRGAGGRTPTGPLPPPLPPPLLPPLAGNPSAPEFRLSPILQHPSLSFFHRPTRGDASGAPALGSPAGSTGTVAPVTDLHGAGWITSRFARDLPRTTLPCPEAGVGAPARELTTCPRCHAANSLPLPVHDSLEVRSFCDQCAHRVVHARGAPLPATHTPPLGTPDGWAQWCWGGSVGRFECSLDEPLDGAVYFGSRLVARFPLRWFVGLRRWLRSDPRGCTERAVCVALFAIWVRVLTPVTPDCTLLLHTPMAPDAPPIGLYPGGPTFDGARADPSAPPPVLMWLPPSPEIPDPMADSPRAPGPSRSATQPALEASPNEADPPTPTGRDTGASGGGLQPGRGVPVFDDTLGARCTPPEQAYPSRSSSDPAAVQCDRDSSLHLQPARAGADGGPTAASPDTGGGRGVAGVSWVDDSVGRGPGEGGPTTKGKGHRGTHGDTWGLAPGRAAILAEPWRQRVFSTSLTALHSLCSEGGSNGAFLVPVGPSLPSPFFDSRVFEDEEDAQVTEAWSHPHQHARDGSIQASPGYHLKPAGWLKVFADHPHGGALYEWARFGFPALCSLGPEHARRTPNSTFTARAKHDTDAWVREEVASGKTVHVPGHHVGPLIISPITTAPKPGSDKLRVCHNLSAPYGNSVNSHSQFSPHCEPITLSSVTHLSKQGRYARTHSFDGTAFFAKLDIKSCYRNFPLPCRDWWLHGLEWGGTRLAHVFIIWGAKPAAHLVSLVTQAICDVLQPRFPDCDVSVFLDDFHVVGQTAERVWEVVHALREVLRDLGIEESVDKFVAPARVGVSLGTLFDLREGRVCVTPDRATKLSAKAIHALRAPSTRRDIESLAGSLLFISPLFPNSRLRLVPLWRWLAAWDSFPSFTQLPPPECAVALRWWVSALHPSGIACGVLLDAGLEHPLSVLCGVSSDSCDFGFAWVSTSLRRYIADAWSRSEFGCMSSNLRELAAFVFGIVTHAPLLSGLVVYAQTDSTTALYAVLNQGSDRAVYRLLVAVMIWSSEFYRFRVLPSHLAGVENQVADSLSRLRWPDKWLLSDCNGEPILQRYTASPISSSLRHLLSPASNHSWSDGRALELGVSSHPLYGGTSGALLTDALTCPCSTASYSRGLVDLWPVFV